MLVEETARREGQEEQQQSLNDTFYPRKADAFFAVSRQHQNYSQDNLSADDLRKFPGSLINAPRRFFSCNAPKTGCTAYNYFYLYVNEGISWPADTVKTNPGLIYQYTQKQRKLYPDLQRFHDIGDEELEQLDRTIDRVVVARNPYVRFLSSYFDWLSRTRFTTETVTFANFTELFVTDRLKQLDKGAPMNHIRPVAGYCRLSQKDYIVLRVEEQALWFDTFLARYGLNEIMARYTNFSGNIVFQSGLRANATVADYAGSISGRETWPSDIFDSGHHRNSVEKLAQYYTPELAAKVTEKQMTDFVHFGYPLWDGNPENFRLV